VAAAYEEPVKVLASDVADLFVQYDWPGNVRELQNVMERGVILTTGPVLSPRTTESLKQKLTARVQRPVLAGPVSITTLADAERAYITAALWETNWMIGGPRGAAAQLGLPRTTLIAKMRKLGIENRSARTRAARQTPQLVRVSGQRPWSAVAL
jgi:formate hydrogenlyase transcriptional activator